MRFKIDENLPVEVADLLRTANYDAITVLEQDLGGAPDSHLLAVCQQEDRILISLDTDFADIRAYPPDEYPGLVVLRLHRQDNPPSLRRRRLHHVGGGRFLNLDKAQTLIEAAGRVDFEHMQLDRQPLIEGCL